MKSRNLTPLFKKLKDLLTSHWKMQKDRIYNKGYDIKMLRKLLNKGRKISFSYLFEPLRMRLILKMRGEGGLLEGFSVAHHMVLGNKVRICGIASNILV